MAKPYPSLAIWVLGKAPLPLSNLKVVEKQLMPLITRNPLL
jgi:hypothetical protein